MAKQRTNVPPKLKQELVDKAGGKCANPGCSSFRTHIHHIRKWAVYQTHDGKHMVALCPSCHDHVHHGPLVVDDATVHRWKAIERSKGGVHDHVYVEPGNSPRLLLGTIAITGQDGVSVFELGRSNTLSFRLADDDIMLLNLAISTTAGDEVLRIVDGYVRHEAEEPVRYERVQGHVRVTATTSEEFMPSWALTALRVQEPNFSANGRLPLLDLEVLEPGLVRVQGIWNDRRHVVAITTTRLAFLDSNRLGPIAITGTGADTVLEHIGPITTAVFGIGNGSGTLRIPNSPTPSIGRNEPCWCGSGKKFKKCHGA
jgi:hypothetical protein